MLEEWRKVTTRKITILVDRSRENGAPVLTIPRGIIGASTEKGNPKRSAADNHGSVCFWAFRGRNRPFGLFRGLERKRLGVSVRFGSANVNKFPAPWKAKQ